MKQEIQDFREDPNVDKKPVAGELGELDEKHSRLLSLWSGARLEWRKTAYCTKLCVDFTKGDGSGEDGVCVNNCFNAYDSALATLEKEQNNFAKFLEDVEARGADVYQEKLI